MPKRERSSSRGSLKETAEVVGAPVEEEEAVETAETPEERAARKAAKAERKAMRAARRAAKAAAKAAAAGSGEVPATTHAVGPAVHSQQLSSAGSIGKRKRTMSAGSAGGFLALEPATLACRYNFYKPTPVVSGRSAAEVAAFRDERGIVVEDTHSGEAWTPLMAFSDAGGNFSPAVAACLASFTAPSPIQVRPSSS
jgi:hypothetical protein